MRRELLDQAMAALAQFASATRLYALNLEDDSPALGSGGLLVEAFAARDEVQGVGMRDVIALSTRADIDIAALLGRPAGLEISLADGARSTFAGEISEAALLGSEGGFARYRLRISHWIWRLAHVRNSRVWQDKQVTDIVDEVFGAQLPAARWRWSDDAVSFMAGAVPRSYCCQYRESDLAFVLRLLAEEGLAWRFEQGEGGPEMVLFADTTSGAAIPDDPSSRGTGVRFHGAHARELSDTVQALATVRRIGPSATTLLSYDYKAKKAVAGSVPSRLAPSSRLPPLESYDAPGQYHYADRAQAERHATIQMESREARAGLWRGRSTLRTLRAGTRLDILGAPLQRLGEAAAYTVLRVDSVGVNNLPARATEALAELFGPIPELLQEALELDALPDFALAIAQAQQSGYANCFEALPHDLPWRPQLEGNDGRAHPRPTAMGAQSAIVVGPDGADTPTGSDEIHCDRLGRVRIRFHWQDSGDATCWVRVAQRLAGGGIGSQFLPRIGQEVIVQFIENDIDRPLIVGAVYNGQGEGGAASQEDGSATYGAARDHAASNQGNLAGGNAPVWHGASGDSPGHRNAAAQWGVRSKEFGGAGYNQLLFDDTDAQGRVQLRTTLAATELNLGHLVHGADNFRGSLRGVGAELRTDAYGAVRAHAGLLVSSYRINHGAGEREPAGDNVAGIALMKQAVKLGESFSDAAVKHETVGLAAHLGAAKDKSSVLEEKAAPLQAMLNAVSGMVGSEGVDAARSSAAKKDTAPGECKLPHTTDPVIAMSAKAGLGVTAGQAVQLSNGETVALMSGQDTQFVTGGQLRVHGGQTIGMLAGAVKPGEGGIGLQVIAAKDAIDVQAQADVLKVQAREEVDVVSANAYVDWAAAKSISLSTADGANITIEGGNITVQCPGNITIHAAKKSFIGPASMSYALPLMPQSICVECLLKARAAGAPFVIR
ncbi:type VI secretion system tip protein VgrG [Massilia sp. G4R7]|uniref:Type VI secretion system tip protein VgrG n=1 Tax=Massilia phyllostachyos TaxID=2898585 RepID=A0ABS8QCT7_9BURK|nr:type VI secretion system Vgr family protein [Massilia phyllostachyos]MCD2518435.1 type VI secretion system tip protein VgrG [Massilia phyllostachyos]